MDIASLVIKVDASKADSGKKSLDSLTASAAKAEKSVAGVGAASSTAGSKLASAGNTASTTAKKVRDIGTASDATTKQIIQMGNAQQQAFGAAQKAASALFAAIGVREIIAYADAWRGAENQLKQVTKSTAELQYAQSELVKIAKETRSNFESTVTLYSRLARSTSQMSLSQNDLLAITKTINQSFASSGATAQEAANAITQLSQGLQAGALRGDEFNSVAENAPGILRAVSDHLKMNIGDLREFAATGGITAEIIVKSMQESAAAIDRDLGKTVATYSQKMEIAKTNMVAWVGLSEQTSGAVSDFGDAIIFVSENIDTIIDVLTIAAGVYSVQVAGALVVATAAQLNFNIAARANPYILLASVASAATIAIYKYANEQERVNKLWDEASKSEAGYRAAMADSTVQNRFNEISARRLELLNELENVRSRALPNLSKERLIQAEINSLTTEYNKAISTMVKVTEARDKRRKDEILASQKLIDRQKEESKLAEEATAIRIKNEAATKAAEAANKKYESSLVSLTDRLYPASASARKLAEETALLEKAHKKGDITLEQFKKSVAALNAEMSKSATSDYARNLQQLRDKLNPVDVATRQYAESVNLLNIAHKKGDISQAELSSSMSKLKKEMDDAKKSASGLTDEANPMAKAWEAAVERIDESFAKAWEGAFDSFNDFADGIKNAFKKLLAELAHAAITKPILISLGLGGNSGGGLSGAVGGSSGGNGFDIGSILKYAQSAYSMLTGVGPAAMAGYSSGGIVGGAQGVAGYYGKIISSALTKVTSVFTGQAAATAATSEAALHSAMAAELASLNGASASTSAASSISSMMSSALPVLAIITGMYQSGKLYSAGVRPDASQMWESGGDSALGKILNVAPTLMSGVFSTIDKVIEKTSFGLIDGKLAAIISGSTFHQALWGGINKKLFGGAWETKSAGAELGFGKTGGFNPRAYQLQEKDGGMFSSSGSRLRYSKLPEEYSGYLKDVYSSTSDSVSKMYEAIGVSVADGALEAVTIKSARIDLTGKSEKAKAKAQEKINKWFSDLSDAMAGSVESGMTTARLTELSVSLTSVNSMFELIQANLFDVSLAGAEGSLALINMAGGLDKLSESSNQYYDLFFTEQEKFQDLTNGLTESFAAINLALPETREGFRALVSSIDMMTEAGRQQYLTLMSLAPAVSEYVKGIVVKPSDLGSFKNISLTAPSLAPAKKSQRALSAESELEAEIDRLANRFKTASDSLGDFIKSVSMQIASAQIGSYAALRREYFSLSKRAALGDIDAMEMLPQIGGQLAGMTASASASLQDQVRELASIRAAAETAKAVADRQTPVAERQLVEAQTTNRWLERIATGNSSAAPANPTAISSGFVYNSGNTQSTGDIDMRLSSIEQTLKAGLFSIAKSTARSADRLDRWDGDGMPEVRTA